MLKVGCLQSKLHGFRLSSFSSKGCACVANLTRRIETVANVVVIVVGLVVLFVAVKIYVLPRFKENPAPPISVGSRISLGNIDWKKNGETLILALSTSCRFCSESAPFYQRLVKETEGKQLKLVAVLPESPEDSSRYLTSLNVSIGDVRQVLIRSLGVTGTPTLILVNGEGKVKAVWAGKLQPDQENEVLKSL
jgi:thiol-disulfide isomerase/thioredoxin